MSRKGLVTAGAVVGGIGGALFFATREEHAACNSFLLSGVKECRGVDARFYLGVAALVIGAVLLLIGLVLEPAATPTARPPAAWGPRPAWPPGWYPDPWGVQAFRWWDGTQWTASLQGPPRQPPGVPNR